MMSSPTMRTARTTRAMKNNDNRDERSLITAMSVTDIVNRRVGATSGPTAQVQDVSSAVTRGLEELVKTKQLASAADAVKSLLAEEKPEAPNPFQGLKELGFNVGDMIQQSNQQAKTAMDELHKAREQVLEEKSKQADLNKQDQNAMNLLLQRMMDMQNQNHENQLKMMTEMYQQRIGQLETQDRKPEGDPLSQLITQMSVGLLKERLNSQPPAAQDQISEALGLVNQLKEMFALNGPSNTMEHEFQKMRLDLEMRKLDLEQEERAQEREERRKREEEQSEITAGLLEQAASLIPSLIDLIANRPKTPSMPQMPMPYPGMMPMPDMGGNMAGMMGQPMPLPGAMPPPGFYPPYVDPNWATGARIDQYQAGAPRQVIQQAYNQLPICPVCGHDFSATGLDGGRCPNCFTVLDPSAQRLTHNERGGVLEI